MPRKNRRTKLVVTFDEDDRKEYLTGFHKRKLQRQEKARKDLEEEAFKLRKEAKKQVLLCIVLCSPLSILAIIIFYFLLSCVVLDHYLFSSHHPPSLLIIITVSSYSVLVFICTRNFFN
eukprot:m.94380 g.94380  ORF g.94380 m.94380 type:complete len:119 (+) comp12412_c1_seq1:246-602(+)